MRNPPRKAAILAPVVLIGAALVWFGANRLEAYEEDTVGVVAMILGLMIGPIPLFFLIQALFHSAGRAKLLAGIGVIARWHVDAATWERFRAFDGHRAEEDTHRLLSEFWFRKRTPGHGIDIIVGEKSILVDDSYHVLRPRGLPELRSVEWLAPLSAPECLEFRLAYPRGRYGGIQHMTLRVPIPFDARVPARKVFTWFEARTRRKPALALRNPKRTYGICLALFLIGLAAGAAGYAIGRANDFTFASDSEVILPLTLIIGGLGLAVFAAILGLSTLALSGGASAKPQR